MWYFHYSVDSLKFKKNVELKMGRHYLPGHVFVNGSDKSFTDLNQTKKSNYSDDRIVAFSENKNKYKYVLPSSR